MTKHGLPSITLPSTRSIRSGLTLITTSGVSILNFLDSAIFAASREVFHRLFLKVLSTLPSSLTERRYPQISFSNPSYPMPGSGSPFIFYHIVQCFMDITDVQFRNPRLHPAYLQSASGMSFCICRHCIQVPQHIINHFFL